MSKEFSKIGLRDIRVDPSLEIKDLSQTFCPFCSNGPLDGCTRVGEESSERKMPKPGDPNICSYCTEISIFKRNSDNKLTLDKPTSQEMAIWNSDPDLMAFIETIRECLRKNADERNANGDTRFKRRRF